MSINSGNFDAAYELWHDFKNAVLYKNRFFVNHEILDHLKHLTKKKESEVKKGTILYRARLYTGKKRWLHFPENDINYEEKDLVTLLTSVELKREALSDIELGFWGFNEKASFVPQDNDIVNDGRTNPAFIKYLYTSEKPYTALVEVRPYLNSDVSIAEIRVNESLRIADFSYDSFGNYDKGFEQNLMYLVMDDFSRPYDSDKKSYIPLQYIAEFIKTLEFEGIKFNSSLDQTGRNITIFNYDKCQAIGSKLYEVKDICFEANGIVPKNGEQLIHPKIEPYELLMDRYKMRNTEQISLIPNPTTKK